MNRLQEYLKKKEILAKGYPKIYIIKSSPKGVSQPIERQVTEIINGVGTRHTNGISSMINRYILDDKEYPFHVDFVENETTSTESGYGSGFGDLWGWTYYSTFSKEDADLYQKQELKRITEKYAQGSSKE